MKFILKILPVFFLFILCKPKPVEEKNASNPIKNSGFTIAFGSCNNQNLQNNLWKEISKNNPNIWIWGGDIIYSDTEDMTYLKNNYQLQKNNKHYSNFIKNVEVLGTWDDHDFGKNDGGRDYKYKKESQQLYLDFLDVPQNSPRRKQEGVYFAKDFAVNTSIIKVIVLDTRYFRTELTADNNSKKRYKPNLNSNNSMLGETQWNWLKDQLHNSKSDYTVIMSSIQFLSNKHGFETWGNMPNEVEKLERLLVETNTKNALILSGDRHISEISSKNIEGLKYPLIDFTSSGMTHSYTSYSGEENPYRIVDVIAKKSFGILKFDLINSKITMEIRGEKNVLYRTYTQKYMK
ncbi:alkaline phosphatase D family protein [Lutibacter sp. TH_r2]|uniref:alkaline phosphatase D family protein n=1 Tax=Lutibacter sp. TH_r2 TaxID=3082083 RepID=UPI002952EC62|nr:alkaline phosphatase D family protein [Lutibacter sp. TH_r2]MDV7188174.1 alkaline phosphatase D family protein [Lutibacter sp. TH_r2]